MYKGELKGFPPEIVEKMLYYQEKQGNKRDVSVFEKFKEAADSDEGFCWATTEEGCSFWKIVIVDKNFDLFFEKYPKQAIVCGVQLEQGKDYYFESGDTTKFVVRLKEIKNNTSLSYYDGICLNSCSYYKNFSFGGIHAIKSIRLARPEESKHLNQCIKANKYVEMKEKYSYEVVHCETQEQWDFVTEKLSYNWNDKCSWKLHQEKTCINLTKENYCSLEWYKKYDYKVYSFSEWCTKFNHQFEEEFKVGDWVVVLPEDPYYNNCEQGKAQQIKNILKHSLPYELSFSNSDIRKCYKLIRKALPHEIPEQNKVSKLYVSSENSCQETVVSTTNIVKTKGLIVNIIEPKQVKQNFKLVPIKLNNRSHLKLK